MTSSIPDNWDVYRDVDGRPVVLTPDQVRAVWHAIRVVEAVRKAEHAEPIGREWQSDLFKSRLLGRLLVGGKPPLPGPADALPWSMGAVDYERAEQGLGHSDAHTG